MVQRGAFGEIHDGGFRLPLEDEAGELQHVVAVAGFRGVAGEVLRVVADREEILAVAVSAGRVAPVVRHAVEEELGDIPVFLITGELVDAAYAGHFRDHGVAVASGQDILFAAQRLHERLVVEMLLRTFEEQFVARHGGEVGEHLVHAAELAGEHFLGVFRRERRDRGNHEVSELEQRDARLPAQLE